MAPINPGIGLREKLTPQPVYSSTPAQPQVKHVILRTKGCRGGNLFSRKEAERQMSLHPGRLEIVC